MTEHGRDPGEQIEHSADQLEEDLHRLENRLDDAKGRLRERQEDAQGAGQGEDVAGDWEDTKPDRPGGDDPSGAERSS